MRHKENKIMRCLWFTFSLVVVLTFLLLFGYEIWNNTAFGNQTKKHIPERSVSYVNKYSIYGTEPYYYVENTPEDMFTPDNREKEKSIEVLMEHDTQLRYVYEQLIWQESE